MGPVLVAAVIEKLFLSGIERVDRKIKCQGEGEIKTIKTLGEPVTLYHSHSFFFAVYSLH